MPVPKMGRYSGFCCRLLQSVFDRRLRAPAEDLDVQTVITNVHRETKLPCSRCVCK